MTGANDTIVIKTDPGDMKKLVFLPLLAIVLLTGPTSAFAADCWTVSGAGSSETNGTYTAIGDSSLYTGGETGYEAYGLDGADDGLMLVVKTSGYSVLYNLPDAGDGGFYVSSAPTTDYAEIDSADTFGSAPVPTIAYDADCSAPPTPTPGGSTIFPLPTLANIVASTSPTVNAGFSIFLTAALFITGFIIGTAILVALIRVMKRGTKKVLNNSTGGKKRPQPFYVHRSRNQLDWWQKH